MLVSTLMLIPHYRTKCLRYYRKAIFWGSPSRGIPKSRLACKRYDRTTPAPKHLLTIDRVAWWHQALISDPARG
jgi:hypothetical protein